jgi:hypothetical protein
LIFAEQPRAALAERHRAATAAGALHLAHEVNPNADQEQNRERGDQQLHEDVRLTRRAPDDLDVVLDEQIDELAVTVVRVEGDEFAVAATTEGNHVAIELDFADRAVLDRRVEVRIGNGLGARAAAAEIVDDRPKHDRDNNPENHVFCQIVQGVTSVPGTPGPGRL